MKESIEVIKTNEQRVRQNIESRDSSEFMGILGDGRDTASIKRVEMKCGISYVSGGTMVTVSRSRWCEWKMGGVVISSNGSDLIWFFGPH